MEQKKGKSLATKISLWVVLFAGLIFISAHLVFFNESRLAVQNEAINHATQVLENTTERVNTILTEVKVATDNTDWLITRHLDGPDSMFVYTRRYSTKTRPRAQMRKRPDFSARRTLFCYTTFHVRRAR